MDIVQLGFVILIGVIIYEYVPKKSKSMAARVETIVKIKKPSVKKKTTSKK